MMNIYNGVKRFLQPHNYNVDNCQNQFDFNNTPGFYRPLEDNFQQYQYPFQPTTCSNTDQPTTDQWSSSQPLDNYQQFYNPPNPDQWNSNQPHHNYQQFYNPPNANCYENGNQYFDENYQHFGHKRAREFYDDDDFNCGPNLPKKQRLTRPMPTVKYAFKKSSQYPQPMSKVLDTLFESEITAEGWEKVNFNGQLRYHIKIRGRCYSRMGSSIDNAREQVAVAVLKELCNYEFENISWPRNLMPYRLEQTFADAIEIMLKNKFDELMHLDTQYKSHKVRAGIVMTNGMSTDDAKVVAIGTGSKCFANNNNDENGMVLHDMHAEVLARRSFVRFLYDQLLAMVDEKPSIFYLEGEEIRLKPELKFHLYVNTIPCGDARVFSLKGCAKLKKSARQGTLRTKKIGGTAIITESADTNRDKSMSCSDKIARWNMLGLQGAALAKYIKPIYLESIVLGSSYVPFHLHRAIFGRLENSVSGDLPDGYRLNKPKFESTFVMEITNVAMSEQYGVCWSEGHKPEVLNLKTGLSISCEQSNVAKASFMNTFQIVNQKLSNRSDEGIQKYNEVKEIFYTALKTKNFGVWKTKIN